MNLRDKKNLRVAIIGGGFGGAAAAVALHHAGIKADLYEQATSISEVGAGIGMRPPTVEFMRKWGIFDAIAEKSSSSSYMAVLTGNGDIIVSEKWPLLTDREDERWARLIHRADFIGTFMDHIPSESVHLNHKCKEVIDHGEYAEVLFENGTSVEADLVIGADGIRSFIRSKFLSDVEPVYSGAHAYRAVVDIKDEFELPSDDNTFRVYVDGDVMVYLLPLHHRNQVSFDVTVKSEDASWAPAIDKEGVNKFLEKFEPKLQKIGEAVDEYTCRALYDIDPIPYWTSNNIALIGDAAHAMLHHQGQGANQAIQDAGVLAECLRDEATLQEALAKYEELRKPIAVKYQELSRQEPTQDSTTAFPEKETFEKA